MEYYKALFTSATHPENSNDAASGFFENITPCEIFYAEKPFVRNFKTKKLDIHKRYCFSCVNRLNDVNSLNYHIVL